MAVSRISVGQALLFLWAAGAVCSFFIHAGAYLYFIHRIGKCPGYFKHDMETVIGRINREYGRDKRFKVLLVPGIRVPAICGLVYPKILMPMTDYTETEIYYILKHEMLHYYRHHMLLKILCEVLCIVFWWNPAVFLLRNRTARMLEVKVDCILTSGFSEEEKISYMECIVKSMKAERQEKTDRIDLSAAQKGETIKWGYSMKQRFCRIWENHWGEETLKIKFTGRFCNMKRNGKQSGEMRKTMSLKMLLRAPAKTLLTFLLIVAASFALFSRVTDYAVTTRETENAESLYHAVAYLNNEVEDLMVVTKELRSADGALDAYAITYEMADKPWPTAEELEEFSSLPGATMAETRYRTDGLVEDYRLLLGGSGDILFEGTYNGYLDENTSVSVLEDHIALKFDDVKVIAGKENLENREEGLDDGVSIVTENVGLNDPYYPESPDRAFYDSLKIGSRYLVYGGSSAPGNMRSGIFFNYQNGEDALRIIDDLPDNYLETESFARQRGWAEAIDYRNYAYSVVYTSDMRAIPSFNDQRKEIVKGRSLMAEDTDGCVVSKDFLREYNLSVGDSIHIKFGDKLMEPVFEGEDMPGLQEPVELSIIGVYDGESPNTIFVSSALLTVEVPEDYEPAPDEFSVFVEKAEDIEAFHDAAEMFAQKMGLELVFSDRGWLDVKDSMGMGTLASLFTTILYIAGAALALFLAVYLYIGRNKKSYAIMRMLGVPGRAAGNSVLMPFVVVAVLGIPIGGSIGLYYAQHQAAEALAKMADSAPVGYVPDATLPVSVVILCLLSELLFVSISAYVFLRNMKNTPPLELLQEGRARVNTNVGVQPEMETVPVLAKIDMAKLSEAREWIPTGNYGPVRHVAAYIQRHMRRAIGKTMVSLILAVVLAAGVGTFVLGRITYQNAFYELGVKGTASDFTFGYAKELSTSSLVKDFYCYNNFSVRVEGVEDSIPMTLTSDLVRNMGDDCTVDYAEGYDLSSFDGTAQICLVGEELADKLGVSSGDEIGILSDWLYATLEADEEASLQYKTYRVIGVAKSDDENVRNSIITGIRNDLMILFSMDFPVEYCEFTLADNDRLEELNDLMETMKGRSVDYSPFVTYHIDSGGLANIERIRGLLESLFPIAVAAAVFIGVFEVFLVILQSAQEAAFLRILGVTKKRARCMLVFEQVFLCVAGITLVAGGIAVSSPGLFADSVRTLVSCYGLYFMGCVCGATVAAVQVTRHRILELLQVKE